MRYLCTGKRAGKSSLLRTGCIVNGYYTDNTIILNVTESYRLTLMLKVE